jgi:carbon starvation protein
MCVSALAMTTIDAVTRIARMSLQELLSPEEGQELTGWKKVLSATLT